MNDTSVSDEIHCVHFSYNDGFRNILTFASEEEALRCVMFEIDVYVQEVQEGTIYEAYPAEKVLELEAFWDVKDIHGIIRVWNSISALQITYEACVVQVDNPGALPTFQETFFRG
jgi:hypothetical protein